MRIEFNLIPAEYSQRPSALRKIFSFWGSVAIIFLCAAEFFAVSCFTLPRLRHEAEDAARARDVALKQSELLGARYDKLRAPLDVWKNFWATAEASAPAHLILAQLQSSVPESASVEAFTIDGEKFQVEILFAAADGVNAFMRRMEKLPDGLANTHFTYGPMKVLERRFVQRGSLLFKFEAPRRKEANAK